jgi:hypothetical protein
MVCAGILGHPLGFNSTSLCGGMTLAGLGRPFLRFRLGAFCLGCLLVGCSSCTLSLDGATSSTLSKLSSLFTTAIGAPATLGTDKEGDEQQYDESANDDCDDRASTQDSTPSLVCIGAYCVTP